MWSPVGHLQFRSPGHGGACRLRRARPGWGTTMHPSSHAAGTRTRTLTAAHTVGPSQFLVRVTRSEERLRHELTELLSASRLGLPVAVILRQASVGISSRGEHWHPSSA